MGDELRVSQFRNTYSRGFAPADAPETAEQAVCVLPGTEIAFAEPIRERPQYPITEEITHTSSVGIFRQIDLSYPYLHHDALELPDGKQVRLNDLVLGQRATVLQLPAAPSNETEAKAQQRLEVVG